MGRFRDGRGEIGGWWLVVRWLELIFLLEGREERWDLGSRCAEKGEGGDDGCDGAGRRG